ncbi:MAG TPA: AI-2E family transporter [Leptolinea sp.]
MDFHQSLQFNNWTFRRIVWATLVLVFIAFCFWLLYRFYQVVFILFVAIVLGTVIRPIVTWLHRRGLPRIPAVILVYLMLFALIVSFLVLLFPLIIEQGKTILAAVPGYYQNMRGWMVNYPNSLFGRLSEGLPVTLPGLVTYQQTGQQMLDSVGQVISYVTSAIEAIFMAAAFLLLTVHWTLDGPRIIQSLLLLVPANNRMSINELISAMETKVGFYVAGQGVLCLVIGIMSLIAYLLIGLPNALVLALVAGVMEAVPMIGPVLGAVPAGVIALSIAPSKLGWVIVSAIVIQQLENSLLVPRVMRKAVGVNPFVTLVAFFAFSSFFGIAGSLMAIPIAAIFQLLLNHFVFYPGTTEPELSTNRDYASRLRYEAQDLAQDLRKQARLKKEGSIQTVKQIDQMMDEIETIATDLDALLAQVHPSDAP